MSSSLSLTSLEGSEDGPGLAEGRVGRPALMSGVVMMMRLGRPSGTASLVFMKSETHDSPTLRTW